MKKLLTYILEGLVDHKDEVEVTIEEKEKEVDALIGVNSEDVGRVIGKQGKTINAIRALAKLMALNEKKRLNLRLRE